MRRFFAIILFACLVLPGRSGEKETSGNRSGLAIMGKVTDKASGEELAGVCLNLEGTGDKAYSDLEGRFEFRDLKSGTYRITTEYVSYKPFFLKDVSAESSSEISVELERIHAVQKE